MVLEANYRACFFASVLLPMLNMHVPKANAIAESSCECIRYVCVLEYSLTSVRSMNAKCPSLVKVTNEVPLLFELVESKVKNSLLMWNTTDRMMNDKKSCRWRLLRGHRRRLPWLINRKHSNQCNHVFNDIGYMSASFQTVHDIVKQNWKWPISDP